MTQGLVDLLDQAVNEPWRWQKLLDNSATLWRYSGGNAAMLMVQMAQRGKEPPTLVAGYKEWERHGRYVLKGEGALWVIAPRTARAIADEEVDHRPAPGPDVMGGTVEPQRARIVGWRGQAVFDVSQTDGEPLLVPRKDTGLPQPVGTTHEELWESLVAAAGNRGFSVEVSDGQRSLASGYTNFGDHLISIGAWLDNEERTAVLAHELAHVLLHGPDDLLGQLYGSSVEHRGLAEIEAESVAYTVLKAHDIDRSGQSSSYLAGWADAVLVAEADSILQSANGCKLLSRTDIAKSVLGRVTSASKCILDVTAPIAAGGRLATLSADTRIDLNFPPRATEPRLHPNQGVSLG
ncbi:ArdC-like ssDNA-binding domain-containing protein [Paenarthrobacter sp. PH39-S1]|uniref:ArdC-like ssDNA-binding domain-containing protein n=1 Tax=Paenarthrobacter sp. PH39-S1 TaxID=3046204 RepID=UPI0024BA5C71|nr:ArdC-like ssDNA-binding domain-containing protein [Paenarthrobacter sp. PH39-S1]